MRKISLIVILVLMIFFSACTREETYKYCLKREVITTEEYRVSSIDVKSGENTQINFALVNNCNTKLNVKVNVFDKSVFEKAQVDGKENENSFTINNYFRKNVQINLLNAKDVSFPLPASISYYISFPFSNKKSILVPVIDGISITRPKNSYKESVEDYGYALIDIKPPIGNVKREDDKIIEEYWAINNQNFKIILTIKPLAHPIAKTYIEFKDISMVIKDSNLNVITDSCDLYGDRKNEILKKLNEEKYQTLKCEFVYNSNKPESYVEIEFKVDYNVKLYFTEKFAILPK